jgi:hypothetical protein
MVVVEQRFEAGTKLGAYGIRVSFGAGGMGAVVRSRTSTETQ